MRKVPRKLRPTHHTMMTTRPLMRPLPQLEATRTYDRPSRSGLGQMLSAEAILLVATYETNIRVHYKSRIHRFVRWTFKPEFRLPLDDHKQLKTEMTQVATDLCRHGSEDHVSPQNYHTWIAQYRSFFRLDVLLKSEKLAYMLKTYPHRFLYSMRLMNRVRLKAAATNSWRSCRSRPRRDRGSSAST